jgi:hypothetical protein
MYVTSKLRYMNRTVRHAFIGTQVDGYGTVSMIYDIASYLNGHDNAQRSTGTSMSSRVSFAIYRALEGCNMEVPGNICGIPHACFSRVNARFRSPFWMYWEDDLHDNIIGFFTGVRDSEGVGISENVHGKAWKMKLGKRKDYSSIAPFDGSRVIRIAEKLWPRETD